MNKSEFIATVAEKAEMTKAAAARAVDAIFDTTSGAITEAVNAAGHLSIPGFGKFATRKRAARKGRNPRTGAEIDIPERTGVSFTPGKGLRESVGGGGAKKRGGAGTKKAGGAAGAKARTGGSRTASAARGAGGAKGAGGKAAGGKAAAGKAAGGKAATRKGAAGGGTRKK